MHPKIDDIAIVEACYRPIADDQQWLSSFLDAARPLIERGLGYGFWLLADVAGQRQIKLIATERFGPSFLGFNVEVLHGMDERMLRRTWYPGKPVLLTTEFMRIVKPVMPALIQRFWSQFKSHGWEDGIAAIAHPTASTVCNLVSMLPRGQDATPRVRRTLARVRIHLETALRLRLTPALQPVAILTSSGRIEHVGPSARAEGTRTALAQRTTEIEAVRTRAKRAEQEDALAGWRALVDGHWSLAERVDSDGKRFYHAFQSPPHAARYRGLSPGESQALHHAAMGLSGKHIAYTLGVSEAAVSRQLAAAAAQLGFASVSDAVRTAARALRGESKLLAQPSLTPAEAEVHLLLQQGHSNARIAELRNSSVRTVANQVARILHKTGAPSRRALLGLELPSSNAKGREGL